MKTLEELQDFYRHGLRDELQEVERRRLNILITLAVAIASELTAVVLVLTLVSGHSRVGATIAVAIIGLVAIGILSAVLHSGWRALFKKRIVARLITELDPGLTYEPKGKMAQHQFSESRLYETSRYNRYHGEDLVSGTLDGTPLSFSELRVQHHTSNGKNSSTTTIFQGLFLTALMPRPFEGFTAIVPNRAQLHLPGMVGNLLQGLIDKITPKHSGTQVEFDDPEFEAVFDVFADKPDEARQILSPDMRARLLRLHQANRHIRAGRQASFNAGVRVSFSGDTLYITLPLHGSWFEPKLFSTIKNYEVVQRFFDDFNRAIEVVVDVEQGLTGGNL